MPLRPALDKNSAPAAARASTQGGRAKADKQWKQVVCVRKMQNRGGVWDGTAQSEIIKPMRDLLQFVYPSSHATPPQPQPH